MSKLPSMPFFPADFFADTADMTGEAAAIYLILLGHAWLRGGSLPNDDRIWGRLARVSAQRWNAIKSEILPFWHLGDDGLVHQKRLSKDYEKVIKFIESKSKSGLKGNEKRWGKNIFNNSDGGVSERQFSDKYANAEKQFCDRSTKNTVPKWAKHSTKTINGASLNQNQIKEDSLNGMEGKEVRETAELVFVNEETEQWNAWVTFYRNSKRVSPIAISRQGTNKRGWYFQAEWPPDWNITTSPISQPK